MSEINTQQYNEKEEPKQEKEKGKPDLTDIITLTLSALTVLGLLTAGILLGMHSSHFTIHRPASGQDAPSAAKAPASGAEAHRRASSSRENR